MNVAEGWMAFWAAPAPTMGPNMGAATEVAPETATGTAPGATPAAVMGSVPGATMGAGCSGPVGWRYIYRAIPLQATARRRVIAQVQLDGWPLQALVDSGARSRIVADRAALRMGVSPQALAQDPGGVTTGVDGHEQPYRWHQFHLFQIGQEQEHAPVLTVAPIHDRVDMLLGSDWFATHRVWISYSTSTLYVMPSARRGG
ncbi:retropepsin-like domain-containing protein [Acetobacter sp. TBRC 12305]|uniref:Retropepsin-like domain-containing protein n=2 Tax=Acetobacter garciniae TaxID=2817435 RepID=A0A939HM06_9PROT|nr:retropepsin-like domain-containing protein [Acetobacter garciniae]MBX0345882.1 retropepsin-like domain-containing protein [Acetobacter garciniae]